MTRIRSFALLGATALVAASFAVPAVHAEGMKTEQQKAAATQTALTAQTFVTYASNADLFQQEASKIAVQRAQSSDVKIYAQQMAAQHVTSTGKITAAARQAGIPTSTPRLTPHMQKKLSELQNASTSAFDERYITLLVEAQERELRLHNAYARSGDNAALRSASTDTAKLVAQHLAEARKISTQIVADRPAGS
jgi:putative membrane protein